MGNRGERRAAGRKYADYGRVCNPGDNRMNGVSYDASGDQLSVNGDTLTYGAENHVTSAYDNVTHNTEYYFYDGMGRRILKYGPAGRTAYVYDAFGQLAAEYSTVPQDPLCTTCYLSYDLRGDVRMVTDQSGNVVARHDYPPFGTELPTNTAGRGSQWGLTGDVDQKFTGQIRDTETGMDYFHARYYGSAFGRFTSPDPANTGANLLDPQRMNWFTDIVANAWSGLTGTAALLASWFETGCPPHTFCATGVAFTIYPATPVRTSPSGPTSGGGTPPSGGGSSPTSGTPTPTSPSNPAPPPPTQNQAPPPTNNPPNSTPPSSSPGPGHDTGSEDNPTSSLPPTREVLPSGVDFSTKFWITTDSPKMPGTYKAYASCFLSGVFNHVVDKRELYGAGMLAVSTLKTGAKWGEGTALIGGVVIASDFINGEANIAKRCSASTGYVPWALQ